MEDRLKFQKSLLVKYRQNQNQTFTSSYQVLTCQAWYSSFRVTKM